MKTDRRIITIICDASFHLETKAAAWAAWFKVNGKAHSASANFKVELVHSAEAELLCVANAVYFCNSVTPLLPSDKLIIQTDCLNAIFALTGQRKMSKLSENERAGVKSVQKILPPGIEVDYRHVKGHVRAGTKGYKPRNYINNLCDKEARALMRGQKKERGA